MRDLTYDVVAVLHHKAKAVEAYETYLRDASEDPELAELLQRIREDDTGHVRELKEILARRLEEELGPYEEEEDAYEAADEEEVEPPVESANRGDPARRGESATRV